MPVKRQKTTAHQTYKNNLGERLPSVSSIVALLDDDKSGAMAHVAWKYGIEGKDYREIWAKKRDAGTLCHYYIDCWNLHVAPDIDYVNEFSERVIFKAHNGFASYVEWAELNVAEVIASEGSFVDEDMGYGGTIDMVYRSTDKQIVLTDHKTGRIYSTSRIQVAAYDHLWAVNRKQQIDSRIILQIDNDDAMVSVIRLPDLAPYFRIFEHLLNIYRLQKQLRGEK